NGILGQYFPSGAARSRSIFWLITTLEPTPPETNTQNPDRDQFADYYLNLLHPARNIERCGTPVSFHGEKLAWRKDESQTSPWNSPGPNHQGVTGFMTGMMNSADFGITEVGLSNPGETQSSFFTKRAIQYVLLPRKTTDELVDAYWKLVYPPHPFLDRYALGNCYESVWTGSGTTADDIALLCSMNVIFALCAQLSGIIEPERRREKAHIYFVRAESIRENRRKYEGLVLCALGGKGINEPWENGGRTAKGLIA
ncbi:hypothetical protein G4B84_007469, partial [Aspergillus flavus NRRL3357]